MIGILFVTSSLAHDGTQNFIMNVYRNLDKSEFRSDFLVYKDVKSDFCDEIKRNGSSIYFYPPRRKGLQSYIALYHFFKNNAKNYSAFHQCSGGMSSVAPVFFAYIYGIPVRIIHSHNSSCKGWHSKVLHYLLRNIGSKLSTHHLACSDNAGRFFFPNGNYKVLYNGIDIKRYTYNTEIRKMVRKELNIDDNSLVVGHVGRFMPVKNHFFILEVFKQLLLQNGSVKLMLIGTGPLWDEVKKKVEEMGLSNRIMFLGLRLDVANLLQSMDCFLMPSLFEGLPFVLIEAQASGLPCVISDVIDSKVDVTGIVDFISLETPPILWADRILQVVKSSNRINQADALNDAGYNIEQTTKYLESIYSIEK